MNLKGNIVKKVDMKNNLTVSVVLATYNGEEFLSEQIESILNQSVLPDEIIFVDDSSEDSTSQIIKSYIKTMDSKGIKNVIIQHKVNLGYVKNFFSGIKVASKDIIFLCDQDDIWKVDKIKRYRDFFESHTESLVLHGNTSVIDSKNRIINENFQRYKTGVKQISLKQYLKKVNYPGMAMAFRNGEFRNTLISMEKKLTLSTHDWFIGFMGCIDNGFFVTGEILTLRRYTGENVALNLQSKQITSIEDRISGINLYLVYFKLSNTIINEMRYKDRYSIMPYIQNSENRKEYLSKKSIARAMYNIVNIRYYPSVKSYLGDLILLLGKKH